jgi:hypothetical protein
MPVVAGASPSPCLAEDDLLGLAAGALADAPAAEAHLAACATCSALLAALVRTAPAPAWDALAGRTLGPYRIDAQIGAGGMGAVYRAWDPRLARAIAIKVLHDHTPAQAERLAIEARAAGGVVHRAIVGIYDVGVADGIPFVAMELVEGESVRSVLARGAVGIARARELVATLVDGLVAAHARGVVHRDLKPENLVITRDGLRILDFGLAKLADATPLDATAPGTVQGTAGYMAPEQVQGAPADARADLFATGAIAYELATGRRAFPGATHAERLAATLRDMPALDELGELAPVVARCLAKEPRDRFQTAADLAWALATPRVAAPASGPAAGRRRVSRRAVLAGGAAALATGAAGFLLGRRRGAPSPASPGAAAAAPRWLTYRTGRVFTARFTHDGTRVVYGAAWDADPIRVHVLDLGSDETVALDVPSGDVLAVSARGELATSLGHRFVDHQSQRGDLAIVPLAGGVPRPIVTDVEAADFVPIEAPDRGPPPGPAGQIPGGALAVVRGGERGFRLELPVGTTLVEEPGWITHARVSPDGARVAYLRHPHVNDDGGDLVVAEGATRTTRVLSGGWASIAGVAWDRDGTGVWFTASRADAANTIHRATLGGEVTRIAGPTAARLRLHDVAADHRALVTIDSWRLRAMAGERDCSASEMSLVTDLSADGSQVLIAEVGAGQGAYLVPYDGGRRLRLGPGFPVAISPSGQRVAANVMDPARLVVYSTSSGDAPAMAAPGFVGFARWIDEASLVAASGGALWRLSFAGPPVQLADDRGQLAIDPGRRRCAFVDRAHALRVVDLATGAGRTVLAGLARTEVAGWLASPDAIVVRSTTTPVVLERIDPVTGARSPHRVVQPPPVGLKAVDAFVLHPDGERFAYSYGQELSQLVLTALRPAAP